MLNLYFYSFLIHRLRLSYLRHVDDPYGSRLISLSSSYNSNPYILAASLADINKWPELALPSSPQLSEDEGERPSGFPGASGLKHTQTIMGTKSGGLGLRVSGRRSSTRHASETPRQDDVTKLLSDMTLSQETATTDVPSGSSVGEREAPTLPKVPELENSQISAINQSQQDQNTNVATDVPAKVPQFIPRFKGAAEMEARRRMRMLARRGPQAAGNPPPIPVPVSNPEPSSSSSNEMAIDEEDSDEIASGNDNDGDDEFDP
jgi:target of rapamycin complex 2 subunit MAPKAP1